MGSINSEEIISILKTEIENYDMVSGEQELVLSSGLAMGSQPFME